jgi:hypothetical protein
MLNPNVYPLVRVIHERRIQEALQRPQPMAWRRPRRRLLEGVRAGLGNRLIAWGMKLKAQAAAV